MATETPLAMCSEYTHSGGWFRQCPRKAAEGDTMCKPHRAGKIRKDANRAEWDRRYQERQEFYRVQDAQKRFVEQWRVTWAKHGCVWGAPWTCPLCNRVLQTTVDRSQTLEIERHKRSHGRDWTAYQAASPVPADQEASRADD